MLLPGGWFLGCSWAMTNARAAGTWHMHRAGLLVSLAVGDRRVGDSSTDIVCLRKVNAFHSCTVFRVQSSTFLLFSGATPSPFSSLL